MKTVTKDPNDKLDYDVDYTRWMPDGDYVVSAVVTVAGGTVTVDHTDISDVQVKVWLTGGTVAVNSDVTVRATTNQGRIKDVTFRVRVKEA